MTLHERFDTRINVQNLLAAMAIAGGLIAWGIRIDSRVSALEAQGQAQGEIRQMLNDRLQRMETKIDRLVERR